MDYLYLRSFLIWILIAVLEIIHGIFRAKIIAPKTGDLRSRQIGVFTGSFIKPYFWAKIQMFSSQSQHYEFLRIQK